jgi:hypothetical protein
MELDNQHEKSGSALRRIHFLSKSKIKLEVEPVPRDDLLVAADRIHGLRQWLER